MFSVTSLSDVRDSTGKNTLAGEWILWYHIDVDLSLSFCSDEKQLCPVRIFCFLPPVKHRLFSGERLTWIESAQFGSHGIHRQWKSLHLGLPGPRLYQTWASWEGAGVGGFIKGSVVKVPSPKLLGSLGKCFFYLFVLFKTAKQPKKTWTDKVCGGKERSLKGKQWEILISTTFWVCCFGVFLFLFLGFMCRALECCWWIICWFYHGAAGLCHQEHKRVWWNQGVGFNL